MKTHAIQSLIIGLIALPLVAHSQTIFSGGDLDTAGNWNNNLPDTVGNTGTVNTNGSFDTSITGRQWVVNQGGGTITAGASTTVDFDGGSWTLSGASSSWDIDMFDFSNFAVSIENGATFNQLSSGNSYLRTGSSFTIDSTSQFVGSNDANENFRLDGGVLSVNGGSMTEFSIRGGSGTFNLDGGTVDMLRNRGNLTLNLLSSGTFSVTDNRISVTQFWSAGSTASVTLDDDEWAEALWNAGDLHYDGQDNATLGTWTAVTTAGGLGGGASFSYDSGTETLTVIPEPSSLGLIGLAGMALYFLRRRPA